MKTTNKVIACKRQYGSLKWYTFNSFDDLMKEPILKELMEGDGYDGIIDIYTDNKELLHEKIVKKGWDVDKDGNPVDDVYHEMSQELLDKYDLLADYGSHYIYPLSELPEKLEEKGIDPMIYSLCKK